MAIVSITEAAELAGVSRGTLYNRINDGQLSKTDDGIDTSELLRVFGPLSGSNHPQGDQKTDRAPQELTSAPDVNDVTDKHADVIEQPVNVTDSPKSVDSRLIDALTVQLESAEREQEWLRSLVEAERGRVAEKDQQLNEKAEQLELRDQRISEQSQRLADLGEHVVLLLAAPTKTPRRKFLGIF